MNVQIEVTTRCNFDCFYCAGRDMEQRDMPFAEYRAILDDHIQRYGIPDAVSLQGEGEPTINRDFFAMAAYAKECGAQPTTITNGTYKYPEHFAQSFTAIGISIDTLDSDEASRIGRHNLPRVLDFVDAVAPFLKITIFTVIVSPAFKAVAAWCKQRGYNHIAQPLQSKPDYNYRYPRHVVIHPRPQHFQCKYLKNDLMRYYSITGIEMPCYCIKDTRQYISISDLNAQLARRQVPVTCTGCQLLR